MQRRRFVAGCACGIGAVLAGCLGGSEDTLEERPAENRLEDAIRSAVGEANTVAVELALAEEGADDPTAIDVDGEALAARLEDARNDLADAREIDGVAEHEADLEAASDYVDAVDGLLSATVDLVAVGDDLAALEATLDDEDFEAASDLLEGVRPSIQSAVDDTDRASAILEALDRDRVADYGAQVERLEDGLADLSKLAIGADHLTDGYQALLTGREYLEDGRSEFESRNFEAAETAFESAGEQFADSTAAFETGETAAGADLRTEFEVATCRSGHLEDAAEHFEAAAAAADDGDLRTADGERSEGEDAVDRAAAC